MRSLGSY